MKIEHCKQPILIDKPTGRYVLYDRKRNIAMLYPPLHELNDALHTRLTFLLFSYANF